MTTYIPALTLPEAVFNSLPASVLLPIALGSAVGYATRRTFMFFLDRSSSVNSIG